MGLCTSVFQETLFWLAPSKKIRANQSISQDSMGRGSELWAVRFRCTFRAAQCRVSWSRQEAPKSP